jgi:hypothetical protein
MGFDAALGGLETKTAARAAAGELDADIASGLLGPDWRGRYPAV